VAYTADETALLRKACRCMRTTANRLARLRGPAFDLFERLKRTAEYQRAEQLSDEGREEEGNGLPAYVLAAAFDNLLRDFDDICDYLRDAVRATWQRRPRALRK